MKTSILGFGWLLPQLVPELFVYLPVLLHVTPWFSRASFPKHARQTLLLFHDSSSHALAKAIMTPDSDDEFGYDFSVEEEELLLQLTSHKDAPAPQQHQANTTAIDAQDGRLFGQVEARNRPTLGHDDIQASREAAFARASLPTPPPLSSTAVLNQEVFYPDRTW